MAFWLEMMMSPLGGFLRVSHSCNKHTLTVTCAFGLVWMFLQSGSSCQCYSPYFISFSIGHQLYLSLAGRAVVANLVILVTTWFIASCWMLHSGVMKKLTWARARWSTILGLLYPEIQSRTLLRFSSEVCSLVRNLGRPYSHMPFQLWFPSMGLEMHIHGGQGSGFFCPTFPFVPFSFHAFLATVWVSMRRSLIRRTPLSREEIGRQPLIWNSLITDSQGQQLGDFKFYFGADLRKTLALDWVRFGGEFGVF